MRVVLLGPPGAGKGTVAAALVAAYGVTHVSSGDLLRAAVAAETEVGRKAKAFMDSGRLVPDEVVVAAVVERLSQEDGRRGFVLDGFPRTAPQAEALDQALAAHGTALDAVLALEVPEAVVVGRLTARRTCEQCGRIYNLQTLKPAEDGVCDACGGRLIVRPDDRPETVRKRLEVYARQTEALVHYYEGRGLLIRVGAEGPVETVREAAVAALADAAS